MTAAELREMRKAAKLTQSRFCKTVGMSLASLRKMESGQTPIGLRTQFAVRRACFVVECETLLESDRTYRDLLVAAPIRDDDAARTFREDMVAIVDSRIAFFARQLDLVRNMGYLLRHPCVPVIASPVLRSMHDRSGARLELVDRPLAQAPAVARHY